MHEKKIDKGNFQKTLKPSDHPEEKMLKEETSVKEKKETSNKELYWIFGVMGGLIAVFLIATFIFNALNTFEYQGMTFTKEYLGEIPYYRYSYNSIITGSATAPLRTKAVNLVIRGDPRKNEVPINGEVIFPEKLKEVFIGVNGTGITQCEQSTLAIAGLANFIGQNGFKVVGGTVDNVEARENAIRYVTCERYTKDGPVFIIQKSDETSITVEDRCYTINVADCEILPAVEKLMVQTIVDAKNRVN